MSANKFILSKSNLLLGMQCQKALYLKLNEPNLEAKPDSATQMLFESGQKVGELAREQFDKGRLIDHPYWDQKSAATETSNAIKKGEITIFEAAFLTDDFFCRVDIFHRPNTTSAWRLIEVKQSTKTKEEHILDVAIQAFIVSQSGLKVDTYQLMHINKNCKYPNLSDLFILDDITSNVLNIKNEVKESMQNLRNVSSLKKIPDIGIGPHCTTPYNCNFMNYCWKDAPKYSVFDIPGLGQKAWDYWNKGQKRAVDLQTTNLNENTIRAINAIKTNKIFINSNRIQDELKSWNYPLYFLDFETINPVIPKFEKTNPYDQIPVQFSCHIQKTPHSETVHHDFLHTDASDPREPFAEKLCNIVGEKGSIVAYNKAFEASILERLSKYLPKFKDKLLNIKNRLVDPLPIIRTNVYHPDFLGSFSIKHVGPAILGKEAEYKNMEVSGGMTAQLLIQKLLMNELKPKEKELAIKNLLAYCRQDTEVLMKLSNWLSKQ